MALALVAGVGPAAAPAATPSPQGSAAAGAPPARYVGINLLWQASWDETQLFADVFKQAGWADKYWSQTVPSTVGPDGWPSSAAFRLAGIASTQNLPSRRFHDGIYRLTFHGQANLHATPFVTFRVPNTGKPWSPAACYDRATNTTTVDVVVTSGPPGASEDLLTVDFSEADRLGWPGGDAARSRGTGVTEAHLWRPGHYDRATGKPTAYFNARMVERLRPFSLVRPMQTQGPAGNGVMGNPDAQWSDRVLPGIMYAHNGVAYEEIVLLANLLGKDVWVCIPLHATDDYIRKVAQLFAFGSDRATGLPYTGPYGSARDAVSNPRPATHDPSTWTISTTDWYPPLDPARRIYLEYSNEIWNSNNDEHARMAAAEVAAGDPWKIAWDGSTDKYVLSHRRNMAKAIQIGLEFRRVLGEAASNDAGKPPSAVRVRNVLAYMVSGGSRLSGTSGWIEAASDYFDHVWGPRAPQATLGPPGFQFSNRPGGAAKSYPYFLYAAASAPYLTFEAKAASVEEVVKDLQQVWDGPRGVRGWGNEAYKPCVTAEARWWEARGVRYAYYEVNLGLNPSDPNHVAAYRLPAAFEVLAQAARYSYSLPSFDVWVHFTLVQNQLFGAVPHLYDDRDYPSWRFVEGLAAGR